MCDIRAGFLFRTVTVLPVLPSIYVKNADDLNAEILPGSSAKAGR